MTKIVPAILEHDVAAYRRKLTLIRQLTDRFQLDVIDGEFVDNRTIQPSDIEPPAGLKIDIHLMVRQPLSYISSCVKLRANTIIVQYETEGVDEAVTKIKQNGLRAGVAINPETTIAMIDGLLDRLDHVLVMAYPAGFAAQKLQPATLAKAAELRAIKPELEIGLDGGVAADTLPKIAKAGFDIVNTNSYLFGADSTLTRYHELMEALA